MEENVIKKTVYLLDEILHINVEGKVSENLIEKVVEIVPIIDLYRKNQPLLIDFRIFLFYKVRIKTLLEQVAGIEPA